LADELTNSIDFDAAIHPSLDGRIFLDMTKSGGGSGGAVRPWNEFMLVHSLALKQPNNNRALAVAGDWLDVNQITKRTYDGTPTLSDSQNNFAPAFWVQQMHFFNGDFRHNADFETYFENARIADEAYSTDVLGETFRYGLTAGVSPQGYNADRILNHPNNVFSPEAVAAWGDMDTFLDFYNSQYPTTDSRYRYGLVRESATQPTWVPNDTALVDHLFLLFGLVESIHPNFYADRVFAPYIAGDFDDDGMVAGADFLEWQQEIPAAYDSIDLSNWLANYGSGAYASGAFVSVPEPQTVWLLAVLLGLTLKKRRRIEAAARR
ncbi:MAG: PEP-CTERM sorting domain-containing protein, partial [Lacipirellulaceae bacterium]